MITIKIILYIVGYILAYRFIRKLWKLEFNEWTWSDVFVFALWSLGSWLSVLACLIFWLVAIPIKIKWLPEHPPKWL